MPIFLDMSGDAITNFFFDWYPVFGVFFSAGSRQFGSGSVLSERAKPDDDA